MMATRTLVVAAMALAMQQRVLADATTSFMTPVKSYQARIESDAPMWDSDHGVFVSGYTPKDGSTLTFEERYRNTLDSVTTASVEGALMYLQRDCIDIGADPITQGQCARKNNVSVIIFLEITIVQPYNALSYYQNNRYIYPEFCPFVTMQNGQCLAINQDILADMDGNAETQTNDDDTVVVHPSDCQLYHGLYANMSTWNIGPCVGAHAYPTDMVAPYPDTVWFSYPGSCVMSSWTEGKSEHCRNTYKGGLCPFGTEPDGVKCTFKYKILGYLSIDKLVGITSGKTGDADAVAVGDSDENDAGDSSEANGNSTRRKRRLATKTGGYANYKEFCEAKGIELHAYDDDTALGLKNVTSIPFWENPSDYDANVKRTYAMIARYNSNVGASSDDRMTKLPMNLTALTADNPPCHKNAKICYDARFGCQRHSYAQVCTVCREQGVNCVAKVPSVEFPKLAAAPTKNGSTSSSLSAKNGATRNVPFAWTRVITVAMALGGMLVL